MDLECKNPDYRFKKRKATMDKEQFPTKEHEKTASGIREKISKFLEYFPTITKEQSDFMEDILKWDDQKRMAFMMAKRIFEDEENEVHKV